MTTYQTNSIWGVIPTLTDNDSKKDMDCICSRCNETKLNDIFIYVWGKKENYKYCEKCASDTRFECNYEFETSL
jgi:uncharacterized protein (DUF983 family)